LIIISKVTLEGTTDKGDFASSIKFEEGVNIISGPNGFGKSLIYSSISWGLGLEKTVVSQFNDPKFLPESITTRFKLEDDSWAMIVTSKVILDLKVNEDQVKLERHVTGEDADLSLIKCTINSEKSFNLTSNSERNFDDKNTNLNRAIFEWFDSEPLRTLTRLGKSWLYLENLAPLFMINQLGGWNELFSQQVRRYGIIDVDQLSVEYILGLKSYTNKRLEGIKNDSVERDERKNVLAVFKKINDLISKYNEDKILKINNKSLESLLEYESFNLVDFLEENVSLNFSKEVNRENEKLQRIIKKIDLYDSENEEIKKDENISLKSNELLEQKSILAAKEEEKLDIELQLFSEMKSKKALENRIQSSEHLYKYKKSEIGFFEEGLTCPTCTQGIDYSEYDFKDLSEADVSQSVKKFKNEKSVVEKSIGRLGKKKILLNKELIDLKSKVANTQEQIQSFSKIISYKKEQLFKFVEEASEQKSIISKLSDEQLRVVSLNSELKEAIEEAKGKIGDKNKELKKEDKDKLKNFQKYYLELLEDVSLTIFKENTKAAKKVKFDENYIPMYQGRELKNYASASDQCRIILPYVIALLSSSYESGSHPGFVLLDEPLQQNPDEKARARMLKFLSSLPEKSKGQLIIFTHLYENEDTEIKDIDGYKRLSGKRLLTLK